MRLRELISTDDRKKAEAALVKAHDLSTAEKDPIILKLLTGCSAWVASLFLLGFIGVALDPKEESLLIIGVILAAISILSHHKARHAGIFVEQSTLSCMMSAHLLILVGTMMQFQGGDELLQLATTQTVLCALPIWAFKRSAYQASSLLLAACFWTMYAVEMNSPWLFRLFLAVEVCALGLLILKRAQRDSFVYALALAVGATIFFLDWIQSLSWHGDFKESLWPTNLIMAGLVAAVALHFLSPENRKKPKIILLFIMLLTMAFLTSPGLLYAIALLILGYGLRDRIFGGLGLLGLPCFIIYFYYSLEVSLLEKSGILFASGIICLMTAYLAHTALLVAAKKEANT